MRTFVYASALSVLGEERHAGRVHDLERRRHQQGADHAMWLAFRGAEEVTAPHPLAGGGSNCWQQWNRWGRGLSAGESVGRGLSAPPRDMSQEIAGRLVSHT